MAEMAEPGQEFSVVELQQAARNHGMPLEALHRDLTPNGLHYVLTHFDIPWLDEQHHVTVAGNGERSSSHGTAGDQPAVVA